MTTDTQIEIARDIEELAGTPLRVSKLGETLWRLVEADLLDRATANRVIRAELLRIAEEG